jgi:hypothetical protein
MTTATAEAALARGQPDPLSAGTRLRAAHTIQTLRILKAVHRDISLATSQRNSIGGTLATAGAVHRRGRNPDREKVVSPIIKIATNG